MRRWALAKIPRYRGGGGFFDTGATVIGLFPWDQLAQDVALPENPRPKAFRGMTLAWNSTPPKKSIRRSISPLRGASPTKPAHKTDYGGYSGYFADPDSHPWEVVVAPDIEVGADRRVHLPDQPHYSPLLNSEETLGSRLR